MSLSRVLLLDTETDGTHEGAQCIEVACSLYSVPDAATIRSFSSLIQAESNDAVRVNGITVDLLKQAYSDRDVWNHVAALASRSEAVVAHGAEFDRRFIGGDVVGQRPWICTIDDVTWPRQKKPGDNLVSLALAHGVGVVHAHRAMADVDLLARLLARCTELGHDVGAMLERGLRPKALFQGLQGYDRNDEAKAHGFRWDAASKRWLRRMAIEDAAALPFATRQVEPCP